MGFSRRWRRPVCWDYLLCSACTCKYLNFISSRCICHFFIPVFRLIAVRCYCRLALLIISSFEIITDNVSEILSFCSYLLIGSKDYGAFLLMCLHRAFCLNCTLFTVKKKFSIEKERRLWLLSITFSPYIIPLGQSSLEGSW